MAALAAGLVLVVVLVAGGRPLLSRIARTVGITHSRQLGQGDKLVALRLSSLNGSPVTLPGSDGKPKIVNVFATWCTPCNEEIPGLKAAMPGVRARGVEFVGIDQQENGAQVEAFARRYGLHYPMFIDSSGVSHFVLGARYIPTTLAIDARGVIRAVRVGPLSKDQFESLARSVGKDV